MVTLVQALLRLIGVFSILRAVDTAGAVITTFNLYSGSSNVTVPYVPMLISLFLQLIISVLLFMAAPKLARVIVGRDKELHRDCTMDAALIISTAMVIAAWGLVRLSDYVYQILLEYKQSGSVHLSNQDTYFLLVNLGLILAAFLMVKKAPALLRKLKGSEEIAKAAE